MKKIAIIDNDLRLESPPYRSSSKQEATTISKQPFRRRIISGGIGGRRDKRAVNTSADDSNNYCFPINTHKRKTNCSACVRSLQKLYTRTKPSWYLCVCVVVGWTPSRPNKCKSDLFRRVPEGAQIFACALSLSSAQPFHCHGARRRQLSHLRGFFRRKFPGPQILPSARILLKPQNVPHIRECARARSRRRPPCHFHAYKFGGPIWGRKRAFRHNIVPRSAETFWPAVPLLFAPDAHLAFLQ